jgi:ABC-type multidrug transport system ATPase subunit
LTVPGAGYGEDRRVDPVVALNDITHFYQGLGWPALNGVTLSVERGEMCGILGPNGAGKTTLVRTMVGALRPTTGTATLFGHPAASAGAARSAVGYLAQDSSPLNHLTPAEALRLTSHLRGLSRSEARRERDYLVDWWGLVGFARREMRRLSGGQRRLALIALACAGAVPLLILDEPTSGLDPVRRTDVWSRLGELNRDHGRSIVLVTHDPLEAERVLGKVVILVAGRVAAVGRLAELKRQLEGSLRADVVGKITTAADLPPGYAWKRLGVGRWQSTIEPTAVAGLIAALRGDDRVADIRVRSANLEDLYLHHAEQT